MTSERGSLRNVLIGVAVLALSGCAEMSEMFSYGDEAERAEAQAQANSAKLWEMSIMAGRYGVMLDQAREILNLPEPRAGMAFPTGDKDEAKQREALARYQANVTTEFLIDVGTACKRRRVPRSVRQMACDQRAKMPAELTAPVAPEIQALAVRNDRVGEFVMPWWDTVCATKPKSRDGEPACVME